MRQVNCYERKKSYMVSLPPTVADWIRAFGGGNLSGGVLDLVRQITDVDALYPERLRKHYAYSPPPLPASIEVRRAQADEQVRWDEASGTEAPAPQEPAGALPDRPPLPPLPQRRSVESHEQQEDERLRRIRQNTESAAQAIREGRISSTVKHFMSMNAQRLCAGKPLFNLSHMQVTQPDMVAAVYQETLALYGCEYGPRPADAPRPTREEAARIAAEHGYPPEWVDAITAPAGAATEAPHAAPTLTRIPTAESDPEAPAEAQHQEPRF